MYVSLSQSVKSCQAYNTDTLLFYISRQEFDARAAFVLIASPKFARSPVIPLKMTVKVTDIVYVMGTAATAVSKEVRGLFVRNGSTTVKSRVSEPSGFQNNLEPFLCRNQFSLKY